MRPNSRRKFLVGVTTSCIGTLVVNNFRSGGAVASSNQLVNPTLPNPVTNPSIPDTSKSNTPSVQAKISEPPKLGWYGRLHFTEDQMWGNTNGVQSSVVWRVVGHAEGNLSPTGEKQGNYSGHVDPGNAVWNRGAFSFQFGNEENLSPEESDKRQHKKIKDNYYAHVDPWAKKENYTEEEILNFMDMLNQAPLCVTSDSGNMMQRLEEAKKAGKTGYDAILYARVESFLNPATGNYDTTFVSKEWLVVDQKRRMGCIEAALPQMVSELQGKVTPKKVAFNFAVVLPDKKALVKKPGNSKFDRIPKGR